MKRKAEGEPTTTTETQEEERPPVEGSWECVNCHVAYAPEIARPDLLDNCLHPVCLACIPGAISHNQKKCSMCTRSWKITWKMLPPFRGVIYVVPTFGGVMPDRPRVVVFSNDLSPSTEAKDWSNLSMEGKKHVQSHFRTPRSIEKFAEKHPQLTGFNVGDKEAIFLHLSKDLQITPTDHPHSPLTFNIVYYHVEKGRFRMALKCDGTVDIMGSKFSMPVMQKVCEFVKTFPVLPHPGRS
jgi:hypothetical protein